MIIVSLIVCLLIASLAYVFRQKLYWLIFCRWGFHAHPNDAELKNRRMEGTCPRCDAHVILSRKGWR